MVAHGQEEEEAAAAGAASSGSPCIDLNPTSTCLEMALKEKEGGCQGEILPQMCPLTCGRCPGIKPGCTDTKSKKTCLWMALNRNMCTSTGFSERDCPYTCYTYRTCVSDSWDDRELYEATCKDTASKAACLFSALKGDCETNEKVKRNLCPRTCGVCGDL